MNVTDKKTHPIFRRPEKIQGDEDDCWIDSAGWWHAPDEATHWMPLPEPPEVEL